MSLPVLPVVPQLRPEASPPDPFGLWEDAGALPPADSPAGGLSFGLEADAASADAAPQGVVWHLAMTSAASGSGLAWLDQRARQVAVIDEGLAQAGARLEALLQARARQSAAGGVSFDSSGSPPAETELAFLLDAVDAPEEGVSFGLGELAKTAGGVNWTNLQQGLDSMLGSVTRQLMYLAWIDTTLDERLVARTTVQWGGDLITWLQPGIPPELRAAHRQSLSLALTSRAANLRTVLTVAQLAGKLVTAVSTPLGAVQALALGWQFVNDVVIPLLKDAKK